MLLQNTISCIYKCVAPLMRDSSSFSHSLTKFTRHRITAGWEQDVTRSSLLFSFLSNSTQIRQQVATPVKTGLSGFYVVGSGRCIDVGVERCHPQSADFLIPVRVDLPMPCSCCTPIHPCPGKDLLRLMLHCFKGTKQDTMKRRSELQCCTDLQG